MWVACAAVGEAGSFPYSGRGIRSAGRLAGLAPDGTECRPYRAVGLWIVSGGLRRATMGLRLRPSPDGRSGH